MRPRRKSHENWKSVHRNGIATSKLTELVAFQKSIMAFKPSKEKRAAWRYSWYLQAEGNHMKLPLFRESHEPGILTHRIGECKTFLAVHCIARKGRQAPSVLETPGRPHSSLSRNPSWPSNLQRRNALLGGGHGVSTTGNHMTLLMQLLLTMIRKASSRQAHPPLCVEEDTDGIPSVNFQEMLQKLAAGLELVFDFQRVSWTCLPSKRRFESTRIVDAQKTKAEGRREDRSRRGERREREGREGKRAIWLAGSSLA